MRIPQIEYLEGDNMVIPYFNCNVHIESAPSSEIVMNHRLACEAALHKMFIQQQSFDFANRVFMATRHSFDPKHGPWKVIPRFWVQGFKIRRLGLPDYNKHSVPDFICDDKGHLGWDLSVYSARRNMSIPGACKGVDGDCRTMETATGARPPGTLLNYIIQHVRGPEIELFASRARGRPPKLKHDDNKRASKSGQHDAPQVTPQDLEPAGVAEQGKQQVNANAEWNRAREILCKAGFKNPCRSKRKVVGFDFFADDNKHCACICCNRIHDSNN